MSETPSDKTVITTRVPVAAPEVPAAQTLTCANCGAPLVGEYCTACGQRHEPHIHTVSHFASEAFESITHADSRLWRTLWFLLARPGKLTSDFFAGRRASYLPPFRLYLVLSIVFFLLVGMNNDEHPEPVTPAATAEPPAEAPRGSGPLSPPPLKQPGDINATVKIGFIDDFCAPFRVPEDGSAGQQRREGIRRVCDRFETGNFRAVGEAVLHNLPRAMFFFLPVLALCMRLLYWRPKRYYVEHLLFLVHNHAFVFLLFGLALVLGMLPLLETIPGFIFWIAWLYSAWYIYRAMRNVYGQGRALTFGKYFFLCITYVLASFLTLLLTFLFAAMTA